MEHTQSDALIAPVIAANSDIDDDDDAGAFINNSLQADLRSHPSSLAVAQREPLMSLSSSSICAHASHCITSCLLGDDA